MRRLYNPSGHTIHALYDGQPYVIPARDVCHVPDHVAEHLAVYYMRQGVRILEDEPVPQEASENELGSEGEHECEGCGQKFGSNRSLKMHKRRAHAETTTDV